MRSLIEIETGVKVDEVLICRNSEGKTLQYGCAMFPEEDDVETVMEKLNGFRYHGRDIRIIKYSKDSTIESSTGAVLVSFKGVSHDLGLITESVIRAAFEKFGEISHVSIRSHLYNSYGIQGGFGFLGFVDASVNNRVVADINQTVIDGVQYDCNWSKHITKTNDSNQSSGQGTQNETYFKRKQAKDQSHSTGSYRSHHSQSALDPSSQSQPQASQQPYQSQQQHQHYLYSSSTNGSNSAMYPSYSASAPPGVMVPSHTPMIYPDMYGSSNASHGMQPNTNMGMAMTSQGMMMSMPPTPTYFHNGVPVMMAPTQLQHGHSGHPSMHQVPQIMAPQVLVGSVPNTDPNMYMMVNSGGNASGQLMYASHQQPQQQQLQQLQQQMQAPPLAQTQQVAQISPSSSAGYKNTSNSSAHSSPSTNHVTAPSPTTVAPSSGTHRGANPAAGQSNKNLSGNNNNQQRHEQNQSNQALNAQGITSTPSNYSHGNKAQNTQHTSYASRPSPVQSGYQQQNSQGMKGKAVSGAVPSPSSSSHSSSNHNVESNSPATAIIPSPVHVSQHPGPMQYQNLQTHSPPNNSHHPGVVNHTTHPASQASLYPSPQNLPISQAKSTPTGAYDHRVAASSTNNNNNSYTKNDKSVASPPTTAYMAASVPQQHSSSLSRQTQQPASATQQQRFHNQNFSQQSMNSSPGSMHIPPPVTTAQQQSSMLPTFPQPQSQPNPSYPYPHPPQFSSHVTHQSPTTMVPPGMEQHQLPAPAQFQPQQQELQQHYLANPQPMMMYHHPSSVPHPSLPVSGNMPMSYMMIDPHTHQPVMMSPMYTSQYPPSSQQFTNNMHTTMSNVPQHNLENHHEQTSQHSSTIHPRPHNNSGHSNGNGNGNDNSSTFATQKQLHQHHQQRYQQSNRHNNYKSNSGHQN